MTTEYTLQNNNSYNISDRIPWGNAEKIIIIFFYTASIILSSVGNILVIIVFWVGSLRFSASRNSEVKRFLTNLAVSDLLISLFCVPFTSTNILLWDWPFPSILCPIVLSIQVLAVTASVITNMAIGLDRFWVVIYPMKTRVTRRKSGLVIFCIWISSILFSSVQLVVSRTRQTLDGHVECEEKWDNETLQTSYTFFILVLTYVTPLLVLLVTYSIVGIKLWKRALPGEADSIRDANHMRSKLKVIKMLSIIVICFGLCWLPLQLFFVIAHTTQFEGYGKYNINIAYVVCHWIAMTNSCVNPVVYSIMNDSFRSDLKWLFFQKCCTLCDTNAKSRHCVRIISCKESISNNHSSICIKSHLKGKNSTIRFNGHKNKDDLIEQIEKEMKPSNICSQTLITYTPNVSGNQEMPILNPHFKESFFKNNDILQIVTQL